MYDSPRSLQEACVDFICENLEALCTPVLQHTSSGIFEGSRCKLWCKFLTMTGCVLIMHNLPFGFEYLMKYNSWHCDSDQVFEAGIFPPCTVGHTFLSVLLCTCTVIIAAKYAKYDKNNICSIFKMNIRSSL